MTNSRKLLTSLLGGALLPLVAGQTEENPIPELEKVMHEIEQGIHIRQIQEQLVLQEGINHLMGAMLAQTQKPPAPKVLREQTSPRLRGTSTRMMLPPPVTHGDFLTNRRDHMLINNIVTKGCVGLSEGPDNRTHPKNAIVLPGDEPMPGFLEDLLSGALFSPGPPPPQNIRVRIVVKRKPQINENLHDLPPDDLMKYALAHILRDLPDALEKSECDELLYDDKDARHNETERVKAIASKGHAKPQCLVLSIGRKVDQAVVSAQEDHGYEVIKKKFKSPEDFFSKRLPYYNGKFTKIVEVGACVAILNDLKDHKDIVGSHIEGPAAAKISSFWERLRGWLKTPDAKLPGMIDDVTDPDGSHHDTHILSVNNMDEQVAEQFQHIAEKSGMVSTAYKQSFEGISSWKWIPSVIKGEGEL